MDIHEEVFVNTLQYSPPPATVPIADLGQYLYEQRLQIVRSFFTARGEFIVEVVDKPASSEAAAGATTQEAGHET